MANTAILSYANTFGDWLIQTNSLAISFNNLLANSFVKSSGTLYLNDPTLGLQVQAGAIFYGNTSFLSNSSTLTINNNLTVGNNTSVGSNTYSNNVIANTQIVSKATNGIAPLVINSTTFVPNLNVAFANVSSYSNSVNGAVYATQLSGPGVASYLTNAPAIGQGTPNTANFTTVTANSITGNISTTNISSQTGNVSIYGTISVFANGPLSSNQGFSSPSGTTSSFGGITAINASQFLQSVVVQGTLTAGSLAVTGSATVFGYNVAKSDGGTYNLSISGNAGTVTNGVYNNGGTYGISISGNAGTVTNGVYNNGGTYTINITGNASSATSASTATTKSTNDNSVDIATCQFVQSGTFAYTSAPHNRTSPSVGVAYTPSTTKPAFVTITLALSNGSQWFYVSCAGATYYSNETPPTAGSLATVSFMCPANQSYTVTLSAGSVTGYYTWVEYY